MNIPGKWKRPMCGAVLATAAALGGTSWVHHSHDERQTAAASAVSDPAITLDGMWSRAEEPVRGRHARPDTSSQIPAEGQAATQGARRSSTNVTRPSAPKPAATDAASGSTSAKAKAKAKAKGSATGPTTGSGTTSATKPTPAPAKGVTPAPAPPKAAPAPAAPALSVSSGVSVPTGNLPGWSLAFAEDFNRDAPLGTFASTYKGWAGYDGAKDTSGNGTYNSKTTMSVHDGMVDKHLHTAGGKAQVAALTPTPNGKWWGGQTHGRFAVRFKSDDVDGYKMAWLLWPKSDNWEQGEIDFPEASIGGTIKGYSHDITGSPSKNAWFVDTGAKMTAWHTAVIEWAPGRLTYVLDGKSWTTTDPKAIPTDPMTWVLQTETNLDGGAPSASASGHVYIDWVAAWKLA
jgi:hypothetical protein